MAFPESDKLNAGELITASFAELSDSRREILAYLGVFLVADIAGSLIPASVSWIEGVVGLLVFGGYFLAQYLLYRAMLRRAGHAEGSLRIFRFVLMSFVIAVALMFAANLFFIPAILLAARWIAAPCYIVAADKGPISSLGESWTATSGNTLPLSLAFTALLLIFAVLVALFGMVEAAIGRVLGTELAIALPAHFLPLLLMGLSVASYRRLNQEGTELAAVFA
jgi:hypothetical protein